MPICEILRVDKSHNWYLGQWIPREGMLCLGAAGQGTARQRKGGDYALGTYQRWSPEVKRKVEE